MNLPAPCQQSSSALASGLSWLAARPWRWGWLVLVLAAPAALLWPGGVRQRQRPAPDPLAAASRPGVPAAAAPTTGLLMSDDFQLVIPKGWERRPDLEDSGPGTKLFLVGPERSGISLVIGVDVYPLRSGTTLQQFAKDYSQRWAGRSLIERSATLCQQPSRLFTLTEGTVEKMLLLLVWRDKGFIVTLAGPAGQAGANKQEFRRVLDTFQVYE